MITVRELIKNLSAIQDQDRVVVLSRDEEGNGFNPVRVMNVNSMYADGEVYVEELTDELRRHGFTEEDQYDGPHGHPAVVLWP